MTDTRDPIPRRNWLLYLLESFVAVTLGAILYPVVRFLQPRPATETGAEEIIAPFTVNELKPDSQGKWKAPFNFNGKPCLVIRTPDGRVNAFNAICTHTDCTVEYQHEKGTILCACHNGIYDSEGRNVSGPPPRPLETYKVVLRGKDNQEIVISREN